MTPRRQLEEWNRAGAGRKLSLIGVGILIVEISRNWIEGHPIHSVNVALGCLFGFVGFFLLDAPSAKDALSVVGDFTIRVITVVRTGRRASDVKAVVTDIQQGKGDDAESR